MLQLKGQTARVISKMSPRIKWLIVVVTALSLYALGGFVIAPGIVRTQATERLGEFLNREVSIEQVKLNPFTFSMSVHNLRIADHDGQELASWQLVYGNFDPLLSIFKLQWHLGEVRVVKPRKHIRIDESGALNVADLIEKLQESPTAEDDGGGLPSIGIGSLSVEDWAVEIDDVSHKTPFHTVIGPMTFSATDFTTRAQKNSPYTFSGVTDSGGTFSWSGTISAAPLGSSGRIEFSDISIPKYMPFVEHLLNGSIDSGKVAFATDYDVALSDTITARIKNATAALDTVELTLAGSPEPLAFLQHMDVDISSADLITRVAEIERVAIDGFTAHVERRPDGSIDALGLLVPAEDPADSEESLDTGPTPSVRIAQITVANGNTSVVDRSTPRPVELLIDAISATVTNVGTDLDREVGLESSFTVNNTGMISTNGIIRIRPFAASLHIEGNALALDPFDPYAQSFADIHLSNGEVQFAGDIEAELAGDDISARWVGEESVTNLSVEDATSGTTMLSLAALDVTGSTFSIRPIDFSATEVAFDQPAINIVIADDRSVNLLNALGISIEDESAGQAPETIEETDLPVTDTAATQLPGGLTAKIDAFTFSGGAATITDNSTEPVFSAQLQDFSGSIRGLSSENLARADVDLSGKLNTSGELKISGTINPLAEDTFSDVSVVFTGIGLPEFSAYSGRYIGQLINSGSLDFDLKYKVSQNVIEGENVIFMDQFQLGEKVESQDSLGLPVGLAVALLRDRNGQIKLPPLSVRGSLGDPDFKYGRVLAHAITTMIGKMATAPFSMLGGLFGGSKDQDISFVDFAPGSSTIGDSALEKLQVLATALHERPALRLEIIAPPTPEADHTALAETRLLNLLREEQALTQLAPGASLAKLSVEQNDALIRSAYARRFSEPEMEQPQQSTATGDDSERSGLVKRVLTSLFGSAKSEPQSAVAAEESESSTGEPQPLTVSEMRTFLMESIEVTDQDFGELSAARATTLDARLLELEEIEPERISVSADPKIPEGASPVSGNARVFFGLR